MSDHNYIAILGSVTEAFQLKDYGNARIMAKIPVFTSHQCPITKRTHNEVHWCILFDHIAKKAKAQLKKGSIINAFGAMHYHIFENKQGQTKRLAQIIVEDFNIIKKVATYA
jgi:single-stranded DNA-binding protein